MTFTNVLVTVGQVISVGNSISIKGMNLLFDSSATLNVTVTTPATKITVTADKCSNLAQSSSTADTVLTYTCKITGTGTLTISAMDSQGSMIATQRFSVPEPQVQMVTNMGIVAFELYPAKAPLSVDNFLRYVEGGFYTNTIFHRVIPNFVAQAGGFKSGLTPMMSTFGPIALESNNGLSNTKGTLAMARTSAPNSATSQFYVNLIDNPYLNYASAANPGYAVFGKVIAGLDVIDAIGLVPTGNNKGLSDVPITEVQILSMARIK